MSWCRSGAAGMNWTPLLTSRTFRNSCRSRTTRMALEIGGASACYQLYEDAGICAEYPGIIDAAAMIGGIQIQSRAGLGGNLCNAAPSADGIGPLIVHGRNRQCGRAERLAPGGGRGLLHRPRQHRPGIGRISCQHQRSETRKRVRGRVRTVHPSQRDGHRRGGCGVGSPTRLLRADI